MLRYDSKSSKRLSLSPVQSLGGWFPCRTPSSSVLATTSLNVYIPFDGTHLESLEGTAVETHVMTERSCSKGPGLHTWPPCHMHVLVLVLVLTLE